MNFEDLEQIKGKEPVTLSGLLLLLGIGAGIAAIVKMLTSGKGRVKLPGMSFEWSGD